MFGKTITIASIITFALLISGAQPRAVAQRPAPFLVKEYKRQDWLLSNGIALGGSLQKLTISDVAGNMQPRSIDSGIFRLAWSVGAPSPTAEISMTDAVDLFASEAGERRKLREAFEAFQMALDELEKDKSLRLGGARLVTSRLAEHLPLPIVETLLYSVGLVDSRLSFLETKQTYVDLKPGFRLNVMLGGDYITLTQVLGSNKVAFNRDRDRSFKALSKDTVKDLSKAADQKAYQRLYYTTPERGTAILRADSYKNLSVQVSKSTKNVFFFRGNLSIIPEYEVHVNGNKVYVPVGTTLRNIVEQEMSTISRPRHLKMRRQCDGYSVPISFANPDVGFDLPLLPGDHLDW